MECISLKLITLYGAILILNIILGPARAINFDTV